MVAPLFWVKNLTGSNPVIPTYYKGSIEVDPDIHHFHFMRLYYWYLAHKRLYDHYWYFNIRILSQIICYLILSYLKAKLSTSLLKVDTKHKHASFQIDLHTNKLLRSRPMPKLAHGSCWWQCQAHESWHLVQQTMWVGFFFCTHISFNKLTTSICTIIFRTMFFLDLIMSLGGVGTCDMLRFRAVFTCT